MDPDFLKNISNISGINFADYVPDKSSYNPIVYIHKRNLSKDRNDERNYKKAPKISKTHNKSQQYDSNTINDMGRKNVNNIEQNSLLEQTIRFAKDIVPLTIPPTNTINPAYYTIQSSKKTKRKHNCEHKNHIDTLNAGKSIRKTECRIREKNKRPKVSNSVEESFIHSSQNNTIDDINENRLCCSLSETSEQRHKENIHENRKCKIIPSESFEAVATRIKDSDIKIHLMDEQDKYSLYENISAPIVDIVKELFKEVQSQNEVSQDMSHVHKAIAIHSNKLDRIIDRLVRIENKLDKFATGQSNDTKVSKLEEIGVDIQSIKDNASSEEELANVDLSTKKRPNTASVSSFIEKDTPRKERQNEITRENIPECFKASTSRLIKPERPNRIPARYCWTDSSEKN